MLILSHQHNHYGTEIVKVTRSNGHAWYWIKTSYFDKYPEHLNFNSLDEDSIPYTHYLDGLAEWYSAETQVKGKEAGDYYINGIEYTSTDPLQVEQYHKDAEKLKNAYSLQLDIKGIINE